MRIATPCPNGTERQGPRQPAHSSVADAWTRADPPRQSAGTAAHLPNPLRVRGAGGIRAVPGTSDQPAMPLSGRALDCRRDRPKIDGEGRPTARTEDRTMRRYLEFSPRGFVNETAICSVEPSDVAEAQAFIDAAEEPAWARWITYRQAERSTRRERVMRRALERQVCTTRPTAPSTSCPGASDARPTELRARKHHRGTTSPSDACSPHPPGRLTKGHAMTEQVLAARSWLRPRRARA